MLEHAALGHPIAVCAGLVGLHERTLRRWLSGRGRDGTVRDHYVSFGHDFTRARAKAHADIREVMKLHSNQERPGDWRAANAWLASSPIEYPISDREEVSDASTPETRREALQDSLEVHRMIRDRALAASDVATAGKEQERIDQLMGLLTIQIADVSEATDDELLAIATALGIAPTDDDTAPGDE